MSLTVTSQESGLSVGGQTVTVTPVEPAPFQFSSAFSSAFYTEV